jgi:cold shock CspA family protein/ribosome-associated translation inhibitor RaiA
MDSVGASHMLSEKPREITVQIPLEVRYIDVDRSEWSENFIRRQVQRLERYADDIISCRVTVSRPHRRQQTGQPYHVLVEVTLPQQIDLAARAEPVEVPTESKLRNVIRDAFRAMERQLIKARNVRRGDVKFHDVPHALVFKLLPEEGYGFLKSPEGEEIYFHRNAVLHDDFDRLTLGTEVRYEAELGEDGLQATSLQIVNKPGVRATPNTPSRTDLPADWQP